MKLQKQLEGIFSQPKVQKQLILTFILILIIPVGFCGFLLYKSQSSLSSHYRELAESDNLRIKSIMFDVTTSLYTVSENLIADKELSQLLAAEYSTGQDVKKAVESYQTLDNIMSRDTSISSMNIYTLNETIGEYKNFHTADAAIQNTDWFSKASEKASVFWQTMNLTDSRGNTYWELTLFRRIPIPKSGSYAVLAIAVSDNYLKNRIDNNSLDSVLTVNQDPVFYSSDKVYLGNSIPVEIDYNITHYITSGKMALDQRTAMTSVSTLLPINSDDKLYIVSFSTDAIKEIDKLHRNYFLIICATIVIPCLLMYLYSQYFSARVVTLRKAMHQASQGNYEIMDPFTGNDELSETFHDLRVMIEEIQKKEAEIYQAQIREQEIANRQQQMEFKMLASQINPHFLYNTLETIRMKAFTSGDREVATAIKLLGKSLRYVLENTGTVSISLTKEINYIRTYVSIQKLRFGDRVNLEERIDNRINLDEYTILPLLLQPVVENSISHGLEGVDCNGRILLEIQEENNAFLCIRISDNGRGMSQEELNELRYRIITKDETRTRSIGLYNINQRLQLFYGSDCQLRIDSIQHVKTTVTLWLPLNKIKEEFK